MKYTPHPFQQVGIDHAADFLSTAKPSQVQLYAAPTGCGKSVVELHVQKRFDDLWIVTPRDEIIEGMMDKLGDPDGDHMARRICTPVKLRNRLLTGDIRHPGKLIFDEGHHHEAETWQQLSLLTGFAPSIAYTATPYRGTPRSTRAFRDYWGEPLWLITYQEAVDEKYISMPTFGMLPLVDDDIVDVQGGDFAVTSIDSATVDRLGDMAEHAKQWYKDGRWDRATVFAMPSTACCVRLAQELAQRGLPAAVVNASTPRADRSVLFKATSERIVALLHINIVAEGVDMPFRRLVDLAPTLSPVRWVQQLGRVTRPTAKDEAPPEYVCIAEGTPILTDRGWVPVQNVRSDDLVWDGEEWVEHDGVVCNGVRRVIDIDGIRMTTDHEVLTRNGWVEACQLESTDDLNLGMYTEYGQLSLMHTMRSGYADVLHADGRRLYRNGDCTIQRPDCTAEGAAFLGSGYTGKCTRGSPIGCLIDCSDYGRPGSARCETGGRCTHHGSRIGHSCSITSRCSMVGERSVTEQMSSQSTASTIRRGMYLAICSSQRVWNRWRTRKLALDLNEKLSTSSNMDSVDVCRNSVLQARTITESRLSTVHREESLDEFSQVYDVVNCGPRHRYQAGRLILKNCTNRNLLRHAYALEGIVPVSAFVEAERLLPPSTRGHARVLGLEAIGRFKPTTVKLLNGCTAQLYCMSTVTDVGLVVQYCCVASPTTAPVWASRVDRVEEGKRTYGSWMKCEAPTDLKGFASVGMKEVTPKQKNWWTRCARRYGLDPEQEVTRKNFQTLPVLADTGVRVQ